MILLKFDKEIKGDSSVVQHENWITCDTLNWSVQRPFTTSGYGQDRDTSNPSFSEVTLTKSMDIASSDLFLQAAMGPFPPWSGLVPPGGQAPSGGHISTASFKMKSGQHAPDGKLGVISSMASIEIFKPANS